MYRWILPKLYGLYRPTVFRIWIILYSVVVEMLCIVSFGMLVNLNEFQFISQILSLLWRIMRFKLAKAFRK